MKRLARWLFYALALALAFLAGYRLTEICFRVYLIPYPFEPYGVAAGATLLFWTFSLLQLAELLISKVLSRRKVSAPYIVDAKTGEKGVELFK